MTDKALYFCKVCGRMRPRDLLAAKRQPLLRRMRCVGDCNGRKTDHVRYHPPMFDAWQGQHQARPDA